MKIDQPLFKEIIESSLDGVWVVDQNNQTAYVNSKMASMLGHSVETILQTEMSSFIRPEDLEDLQCKMKQREEGVSEQHEWRFVKKDGSYLWTLTSCIPLFNEQREYIGSAGMISDITEKKRSDAILKAQRNVFEILIRGGSLKEALHELLAPIEELINGVRASILILDQEGAKFAQGFALNLPSSFMDAILGEEIGPVAGSCGTAAYLKESIVVCDIATDPLWEKYRDVALAHELRACWSSPIINSVGKVLGTFAMYFNEVKEPASVDLAVVKDVIAAAALSIEHLQLVKQMELMLENEKKHFRDTALLAQARKSLATTIELEKVLEPIPKLIISHFADWCYISLTDDEGVLRVVTGASSPAIEEGLEVFKGYKADRQAPEGLPRAIREKKSFLYSHLSSEELRADNNRWPSVGTREEKYLKIIRELGFKSYMAIPLVVRGEAVGGMIVGSVQAGRHYNQRDLELMDEIARSCSMAIENALIYRESQRSIQNREDFISVASHELRTPLTSLQMRVDLLAKAMESKTIPDDVVKKLRPIVTEIRPDVKKFTKLIETLLDVSKLRNKKIQLDLEEVNLSQLIEEEVNRHKAEFEDHRSPIKSHLEKNVMVICDSIRIQQVVTNLLSNALKFGEQKPVEVILKTTADKAILQIKDNGIGISLEDKWRIFKPFERAVSDRHFGGLGLGLYISQQIIEEHNGSIHLESVLGQGSSFVVELPRRQQ